MKQEHSLPGVQGQLPLRSKTLTQKSQAGECRRGVGQNERVAPGILLQSVVEAEAASVMFKGSDLGRNCECFLLKQSPGHEVRQRATPGSELQPSYSFADSALLWLRL